MKVRTEGNSRRTYLGTIGLFLVVVTVLPVTASYADSSQKNHWTRSSSFSSTVPIKIVEKDTIKKFTKDVAVVLHVLKASEYGSDPTIPGTNKSFDCLDILGVSL